MKKKKIKNLSLKKTSVSNLNGGAIPTTGPILLTINIKNCAFTNDIFQCTWVSELYSACQCDPSWDFNCNTQIFAGCAVQ
jgi:hypothetical protein